MRPTTVSILGSLISRPAYFGLATLLAVAMFSLVMWLPNLSIILTIWQSSTAGSLDKLAILWALYGSLGTDFTLFSATFIVLLSVLFGIHISVLTFYIRQVRSTTAGYVRAEMTSFFGMIAAGLGIGCAACGSLVFTSLLATFGATGLLAVLPYAGAEFGVLGVLLLGYSTYTLLQKISTPKVCL